MRVLSQARGQIKTADFGKENNFVGLKKGEIRGSKKVEISTT
jgi:hypothetical protein